VSGFGDAFLDDYFAECEEHLSSIRQSLLLLEQSVGQARPDSHVTEELFRGYHSLKGLAGMVEDRRGEMLSHEMESYLRAIREGDVPLTTRGVETLIDGTRCLDETVRAMRAGSEPPSAEEALAQLRELVAASSGGTDAGPAPLPQQHSGTPRTECIFTPSAALSVRGINVDTVRGRLRQLGDIVSAMPLVGDNGAVAFKFILTATVDAATAEAWRADGIAAVAIEDAAELEPITDEPIRPVPALAGPIGHYVRVDLSRLDDLMRMIGDLVILRARLGDALGRIEPHVPAPEWRAVQENAAALERQLRELRDGVMRVRLVAVGEIFRRMPFVVRDLARESNRRVQVTLAGQETQIDKFLVERMMDPVLHLVRNAVSHGLETIEERVAAGKPPEGTVALSARASGEIVTIDIADDGRGVDAARVVARARQAGLPIPAGAETDENALLDLICSPGFSTREDTDRGSGRGFGMAVVRRTVQELGGTLHMHSTPGVGTRFSIDLPLTLAITDALIAAVGPDIFAVPQNAVREVIEVDPALIHSLEAGEVTLSRGATLPIVRLANVLGIAVKPQARYHALVIRSGQDAVGLLVDRVISQREIVVRTTADPLIRVDGIAGATDLGDGRAVLILDVVAVARGARGSQAFRYATREIA
jgi:two-component system, chemotaxis family, sensor kinase CheA